VLTQALVSQAVLVTILWLQLLQQWALWTWLLVVMAVLM
jgi:hypothetical protein